MGLAKLQLSQDEEDDDYRFQYELPFDNKILRYTNVMKVMYTIKNIVGLT